MRQALELALEFIERVNKDGWILADFEPQMYEAITAIKEALAQPEQEPWPAEPVGHMAGGVHPSKMIKSKAITEIYALFGAPHNADINLTGLNNVLDELMAQPEQEPVGKFAKFTDGIWREVTDGSAGVSLYTTPPQRTWVGLTQDELNMIGDSMRTWNSWTITDVYFAIEAKLKDKNT